MTKTINELTAQNSQLEQELKERQENGSIAPCCLSLPVEILLNCQKNDFNPPLRKLEQLQTRKAVSSVPAKNFLMNCVRK